MNYHIHANAIVCCKSSWQRSISRVPFKPFLIMKLIVFLVCCFSFSSLATVKAQKVNLDVKNESIQAVIKKLQQQTGYSFIIHERFIRIAKPVTVQIERVEILEALPLIFGNQPFTYEVNGKTVTAIASPVYSGVHGQTTQSTVRGRVTDSIGNGLEGVIVELEGTSIKTVSDKEGYYALTRVLMNGKIVFRLIGYEKIKATANRPEINVTMRQVVSQLNEVYVERGYYTISKKMNTGSVSTVSAEEIARQPVNDPLLALQGRIPGLYIAQESGVPGSKLNIQLRGRNSIANGNDPLYIVDGVPFPSQSLTTSTHGSAAFSMSPFASIGMDNIESIDVLKDADATAIYGSRGANGVILITTKKGSAGKTKIDLNVSSGFGKPATKLELLNTEEYLQMRYEAFKNDGAEIGSADYDLNGTWGDIHQYTDWQEVLIGKSANLSDARLNISGGNDQTQFLLGGSWRHETTVFPGDFRDSKFGSHFNINHKSNNERFRVSLSTSYLKENNKLPTTDFTQRIALAPNTPSIYNADGSLNWQNSTWQNPLASLRQTSTTSINNLNSTLNLTYEIWRGIRLNSRFGYNEINWKGVYLVPFSSLNPSFSNPDGSRQHRLGTNHNQSWIIEPTIEFSKNFVWAKVESLIGLTFQESQGEVFAQYATGFSSDAIIENMKAATTLRIFDSNFSLYRYNAIFGRVGFSRNDKYSINLTARRDGSSRFSPGRQFGNFAAVGAAWIFSDENLFENHLSFISFGKLRASYGITGNDQTGDYQYLSRYNPTSTQYQGAVGLTPVSHTSIDYGWESVRKLEAGVELGFLKDRLMLNVSLYRNRTRNQLVGYPLPNYTGFSTVTANLPAVIQNTGLELEGSANIVQNRKFNWSTSANISFPRNKLVSYPNFESSSYTNTLIIGEPLFLRRMYTYQGIDPETGLYTFIDYNNDGTITYNGDTRPTFVGQRYFGGVNNSFSYRGLQLDVFAQFVKQNGYLWDSGSLPGGFSTYSNIAKHVFDNRSSVDILGDYQRLTQERNSNIANEIYNFQSSNGMIGDASFIRLKNVTLSYSLPSDFTANYIKITSARFYVQGQNLATITNFRGLDPENSGSGSSLRLAPLRMLTFGIQVTL